MFLFIKTNESACSGSSRERALLSSRPVAEKSRSDCTEVAGMARYFLARAAALGNAFSLRRHHSSAVLPSSTASAATK